MTVAGSHGVCDHNVVAIETNAVAYLETTVYIWTSKPIKFEILTIRDQEFDQLIRIYWATEVDS